MEVIATNSFFNDLKKIGSIGEKWRSLKSWVHYHTKKDFWKIVKEVFSGYPWDETYLLRLERAKINEMLHYHERNKRFEGVEFVIRDMKLCLHFLDIMISDGNKLYTYHGSIVPVKLPDGNYKFEETPDFRYTCFVKVNINNIKRFVDNEKAWKWYIDHPHELYVVKAAYLYHKIRHERENYWWD